MRRLPLLLILGLGMVVISGHYQTLVYAQPANGDLQPTQDSHQVVQGDTLWDLSETVLGTPWAWPRVWSYNPEITNPHWIYPGDIVRFYPPHEQLPSQTDLIANQMEIPEDDEYMEIDEISENEYVSTIEVIDTAPEIKREIRSNWARFVQLFVTPEELAEAGTLTSSASDKMLFSANDSVYLSFPSEKKPQSGERYMVYRTLGRVFHPKTRKPWGYMTQITGFASIQASEKNITRAVLDTTMFEIERGHYVAPMLPELASNVVPKLANQEVKGVILAVQFDGGVVAGDQQVVFVDKGAQQGLGKGDQFKVIEQGDPLTGQQEDMPFSEIGRLIILHTTETTSTCLVTSAKREIEPGSRVISIIK